MTGKKTIDIIEKVLDACYREGSYSLFIMSLMHQYEERGSLSKKQLQGLYQKARKIKDMPPSWLATLEAIILKMPTRYKSALPDPQPLFKRDEHAGKLIAAILSRYPQHKRVLFIQARYVNNETITPAELSELEKFSRLLLPK